MTTHVSPTSVLFGEDNRRLLGLLLMRPGQGFHLREIARLAGVDAGNAQRALKRLAQAGLVTGTRSGNQLRYEANRDSPIFPELQGLFRKTTGLADVLREALEPLARRIAFAFVFGSIARGEEGPASDIDLLVVGEVPFDEVVAALYPVHQQLGREVNPVVLTPAEFRLRVGEKSFVARVMAGEKLMILGSLGEP
jgi:predicted nucleotidyltransferase